MGSPPSVELEKIIRICLALGEIRIQAKISIETVKALLNERTRTICLSQL
jgi:hypothetical protein